MLWLLESRGPERFVKAYRSGDLEKAYGSSVSELEKEWRLFLGSLGADEKVLRFWAAQFAKPAIFGVKCAHEVASARLEAADLALKGKPGAALAEIRAVCSSACENQDKKTMAEMEMRSGDKESAVRHMTELLSAPDLDEKLRADALDWLGMAAWENGDASLAAGFFRRESAMSLDTIRRRNADLHLEAAEIPDARLRETLRRFFTEDADAALRPVFLERAISTGYAPAHYLMGRHLFNRSEFEMAVPQFEAASGILSDAVRRENARLMGVSLAVVGNRGAADDALISAVESGSEAWKAHIEFMRRIARDAPFESAGEKK
jgi:hypothetical protein